LAISGETGGVLVKLVIANQVTAPTTTPADNPPTQIKPSPRNHAAAEANQFVPASSTTASSAVATSFAAEAGATGTGGATVAGALAVLAFGNCGGAGGGTFANAACAVDNGSDNVIEDSVAIVLAAATGATPPSDDFQSTGGTTCTMLPQRGQFKMLPTTDSSLTLSRARQVVQCTVNGSTYGSREKGNDGKPGRRCSVPV
jgi:hypothetical protein